MESYSPSKRRALAPLDANAKSTPKHYKLDRPTTASFVGTPLRLFPDGRKRGFEEGENITLGSGKKACLGRDEAARSRSQSPDTSSVFDTSGNDASWATAATEVDVAERVIPPRRTRGMTREEAREKAEILRLRLSLANYKLRTGQTNIPLADLQPKPLPQRTLGADRVVRVQSPQSSPERLHQGLAQSAIEHIHPEFQRQQEREDPGTDEDVIAESPPDSFPVPRIVIGGGVDLRHGTTTPVTGGAASGLLSLSQGSSSS
ncbi:Fc.00g108930.m01.CDS01 [Cosmosporella sp. VM-42]